MKERQNSTPNQSYINECATLEDDCPVHRELSDEDIIKEVQADVEEVEETQEVETKIPSATEAAAGLQDEDIIKEVQAEVEEVEETQEVETKIPSATEAAAGLQAGLQWLETQEIDPVKLIQLRGLLDIANKFALNTKTPKKSDFFRK